MTIVVGYVPTAEGDAALTAAIEEADRRSERVHVLNSTRGPNADSRFLDEDQVAEVRSRLAAAGVDHEIQQLVRGKEAAEEIVEAAERLDASLIVIGLRRRTATGKLLFGSQAQRILLDAECPVLAVKAPA
jgi:nucleotide-binding universal stress UspA family protein